MSAKVERNFRAAICAEGARGASTVDGDLEIAAEPITAIGSPGVPKAMFGGTFGFPCPPRA